MLQDVRAIGLDDKWSKPEWLVVSVLPVPPLHVRPQVSQGGGVSEDDLTLQLCNVIKHNKSVEDAMQRGENSQLVEQLILSLQHNVSAFMDNELRGQPQVTTRSGRPLKTLVGRLKGKEGRIR